MARQANRPHPVPFGDEPFRQLQKLSIAPMNPWTSKTAVGASSGPRTSSSAPISTPVFRSRGAFASVRLTRGLGRVWQLTNTMATTRAYGQSVCTRVKKPRRVGLAVSLVAIKHGSSGSRLGTPLFYPPLRIRTKRDRGIRLSSHLIAQRALSLRQREVRT